MLKEEKLKRIRDLSYEELEEFIVKLGEKKFRARQVWEWLWKKGVSSFEDMRNISKPIREGLSKSFYIENVEVSEKLVSKDKTEKLILKSNGDLFEAVLIPSKARVTACISLQIGCKLNCAFCATGKLGFKRDLTVGEIFSQLVLLNKISNEDFKSNLTNIVLMGMGEPLNNTENVLKFIDRATSEDGLNISPNRITLSTAGIASEIKKLADLGFKANLAVSLHSADRTIRNSIMPINKSNDLEKLRESLIYFHKKTKTRITFEYLLLDEINDTREDAEKLAEYCKSFPVKINIIEYNAGDNSDFKKSKNHTLNEFVTFLESRNLIVNVRRSRGADISGACGQLANKRVKS